MSITASEINLDGEQLSVLVKTWDKPTPCPANTNQTYYILTETGTDNASRVVLKNLKTQLPLDDLRRRRPDYQERQNLYVDVDGDYFPALIEENGIFLVSEPFLNYLQNTVHLRKQYVYNYLGLCTAHNRRIETYCLLVPPQLDCILPGSERYDKNHTLIYFEIDETKVGKREIFRVKGFPHLIITQPVNRIDYAGYECTRIETYFDYAGTRDRDYHDRQTGQQLMAELKEYDRRVTASDNYRYKHELPAMADMRAIRQAVATGLRQIFTAYQGQPFPTKELATRRLTFNVCGADGKINLTEATDFNQTEFTLSFLPKALACLENVPEVLKATGSRIIYETVLTALVQEARLFDTCTNIHGGTRFRIYCTCDFNPTTNPPMIYDYQCPVQRSIPATTDFRRFEWQDQDLRECDFSGQTLSGLKITGANLSRAKFNGCVLNNTEFNNCDLTGAEFKQAKLQGAKFTKCELNRTCFDNADLQKAELTGSDLFQCSFVKADLSSGLIKSLKLSKTYFYRAKLQKVRFQVRMTLFDVVFRLCDLRGAQFNGAVKRTVNIMSGCDFSNSDLSESRFTLNRISKTNFTKAKLIEADFSNCNSIGACNFTGSNCGALNLDGLQLDQCNFTKVNLSLLKPKSGAIFTENNNFTYSNFSGYDFSAIGFLGPTNFCNANLSNCNLTDIDLRSSNLLNTNLNDATMNQAVLEESQLQWVKLSAQQREAIRLLGEDEDDETNDAITDGDEAETNFEMDGDDDNE